MTGFSVIPADTTPEAFRVYDRVRAEAARVRTDESPEA